MTGYVVRRTVVSLILILAVATIAFFVIRILPGDPVMMLFSESGVPDAKTVAAIRTQLGLDKPLLLQYASWIKGLFALDFGRSLFQGASVRELLAYRLPKSLELILSALLLAVVVGIPMGALSAYYQGTPLDMTLNVLATGGIASPVYVIGILMVLLFAFRLRWLPATGYVDLRPNCWAHVQHLVLPVVTLSITQWAQIVRMTRSSVIDALYQDYVRTARAKGLPEGMVASRHVLRNSMVPVVTVIGLEMGRSLGSTVLVEAIFNWPGISSLLISSVTRRDYPVIQAIVLLIGVLFILINFVTDLMYAVLDPRIRYS